MPVSFAEIRFYNTNGIDEPLTIEAPIGKVVYGPKTVPASSSVTINPNQTDCQSVLIRAGDPPHHDEQSFATIGSRPLPAYLERLSVRHAIGSLHATLSARTEQGD